VNYLQAEKISKAYGTRVLFENLSLGIDQGQKIALVARNGSGKSTILRMLAGLDSPDSGEINSRNGITVGYLAQEPDFDGESTVLETVFNADSSVITAIRNYEHWLDMHAAEHTPVTERELQKAMEAMDTENAWELENHIKTILTEFDIPDLEQKVKTLSGGQKKRLAMSIMLIRPPDVLLLDEPTNHLDIEMIEWLESTLSKAHLTLLMVTHDRYFLDKVCNEILELDEGEIFRYKGNYAYYLEKKAERETMEVRSVEKAKNLYSRELEWIKRQPKARGTKSKARVDAFDDVKKAASRKTGDDSLELNIKMNRVGGKILELKNISKSYGEKKLVKNFSYVVKRNDRIGIVGKNGTGKSTLLKMIIGELQPDAGKVVLGDTVVPGYYSQQGLNLKEDKRVIEVVRDIADYIPLAKGGSITASQLLQRFLFRPDQHYTFVSKLSGGERKRLYLLTILMKNPNFLILDEPTNDLDLVTLNVFEEFLEDYDGVLIMVSHDRYFMDRLSDHMFVFEGEGVITDFNGNYSDYRQMLLEKEKRRKEALALADSEAKKGNAIAIENITKRKLSFKEKKEMEELKIEIDHLEKEKKMLEEKMSSGALPHNELAEAAKQFEQFNDLIETKTWRLMELEEC
jgi:ATP-binding cassette subfamily F protein uup